MESYLTIRDQSEGVYKEKGSKFLASAFPVSNENDVKNRLDALRKKYYDARHHCYAYVTGPDQEQYRANDDGEPHHSAGDPILGQIRSHNLTNTLIVVVRYFGGTKLGISGLINAYKLSATDALGNSKIIKVVITQPITLKFQYDQTNEVMKLVTDFGIKIQSRDFTENCAINGSIQPAMKDTFEQKAKLIKGLVFWF